MKSYGNAGTSLGKGAANGGLDANRAKVGSKGEQVLDERLRKEFSKDPDVHLFRSMQVPGKRNWGVDVDFILVSGRTAVLVDSKVGKQGKFYWNLGPTLMCGFGPDKYKNKSGKMVRRDPMSKNMDMAVNLWAKELRKVGVTDVVGMIIYVPSSSKGKTVSNTTFLKYPGGIKAYVDRAGIRKARALLKPGKNKTDPAVINMMKRFIVK